MLEAIERIEKYSQKGENRFRGDDPVLNWFKTHIKVIGEAAGALTPALRERRPEIPWTDIIGMRNVLVHRYFGR
jgi:uncharacterized protein with HEPN domain